MLVTESLLRSIEALSIEAGEKIMEFYGSVSEVAVETKADDSPVTAADFAANDIIVNGLQALTPQLPIISEEAPLPEYSLRKTWPRYWLVDPLDGTKEFIAGNGEFTVNIALIEQSIPVMGCVYAPAMQTLYSGALGFGAWKKTGDQRVLIQSKKILQAKKQEVFRVIGSRAYGIPDLPKKIIDHFSSIEYRRLGSSLKLCLIAEGAVDFYPRHRPTKEWDTAAAQAVLESSGGAVLTPTLEPLRYNLKAEILNPSFYVVGDQGFDWSVLKTGGENSTLS